MKKPLFILVIYLAWSSFAHGGVFGLPRFVEPEHMSLGLEPELTFANPAGLGANLKTTLGLTDFMDGMILVGTGNGTRRFRVGGALSFDLFPDIEGQPGIGIASQAIYYRKMGYGRLETTLIPYIHKTFVTGEKQSEVEPFAAFPVGVGFRDNDYVGLMSFAIGGIFKHSESFRSVLEFGININHMETALSAGVIYYY